MIEIIEEVFFDSDLLIFGLILIVVGFLISEFAIKKLNAKIALSAGLVIIYVISSFLINVFSSYLANFIFLFIGGAAISLFFGFAVDIIFNLIKRKK